MLIRAIGSVAGFILAVVIVSVAVAATGDPRQRDTAVGMAHATSALLPAAKVGAGWEATDARPGTSVCTGPLKPNESDLIEIGSAWGPIYGRTGTDHRVQTVFQTVEVFTSSSNANTAWSRAVKVAVECMARELHDARMTVTREARLSLAHVTGHVADFRVAGVSNAGTFYVDQLLVGAGNATSNVLLTSFARPVNASFEEKLVRAIAARLRS